MQEHAEKETVVETTSNLNPDSKEFSEATKEMLTTKAKEKLKKDLEDCDSAIERTMCESEYEKNLDLIKKNINPFDMKKGPDASDFECVGCSA